LLRTALRSPVDYTAISIHGKWIVAPGSAKSQRIGFELALPNNFADIDSSQANHMHVEFVVQALAAGKENPFISRRTVDIHLDPKGLEQIEHNGLTFRSTLALAKGDYVVRFVVLDVLSGRMGSTSAPLKVD
ncbi:MAG TPA: hypothetical protein VJQ82_03325, partial [Terriglobales bacterium]|nr:hypothetical protein [Terriglobales bacterium]